MPLSYSHLIESKRVEIPYSLFIFYLRLLQYIPKINYIYFVSHLLNGKTTDEIHTLDNRRRFHVVSNFKLARV